MSDEEVLEHHYIFAHIACHYLFGLNPHIDVPGLELKRLKKLAVLHDPMLLYDLVVLKLHWSLHSILDALDTHNYEELHVSQNRLNDEVYVFRTIYNCGSDNFKANIDFIAACIYGHIESIEILLDRYQILRQLSHKCVLAKVSRNIKFSKSEQESMINANKCIENANDVLRENINLTLTNLSILEPYLYDDSLYDTRHICAAKTFLTDVLNMPHDYNQSFSDTHNTDCTIELNYSKLKIQYQDNFIEYTFDVNNKLQCNFGEC